MYSVFPISFEAALSAAPGARRVTRRTYFKVFWKIAPNALPIIRSKASSFLFLPRIPALFSLFSSYERALKRFESSPKTLALAILQTSPFNRLIFPLIARAWNLTISIDTETSRESIIIVQYQLYLSKN